MILELSNDKVNAINAIIRVMDDIENNFELVMFNYPSYCKLLDDYKKILLNLLDKKEKIVIDIDNGELYCREHVMPDGNTIEFAWSIPILMKLIKNNQTKVIRKNFKIEQLIEFLDFSGLESDRFSYALNNTDPVLVIEYAPSNLQVMIDGNHRVASRYLKFNDKSMLVSGIYIPTELHIKSMATDIQKIMFKVFSNIGKIYNFLECKSKNEKAKKPQLFNVSTYL